MDLCYISGIILEIFNKGTPMSNYKLMLLCGGESSEHSISLLSANYIQAQLKKITNIDVTRIEITKDGWLEAESKKVCHLDLDKTLRGLGKDIKIDYVIPCIHGYPGETGDIQSLLEMAKIPYLGCDAQASMLCFNKVSNKLWLDAIDVANTPYKFLTNYNSTNRALAREMFEQTGALFVKAASQGSSVGCFRVDKVESLDAAIEDAFTYSEQVLLEKALQPRELEVAAYQYQGKLHLTPPGEIVCAANSFYTYAEKYSSESQTHTEVVAKDLTAEQLKLIEQYARKAFTHLGLKDLARIDMFLTEDGEVYLNEINTFPGMTAISMFPKMLEYAGVDFSEFLRDAIEGALKVNK